MENKNSTLSLVCLENLNRQIIYGYVKARSHWPLWDRSNPCTPCEHLKNANVWCLVLTRVQDEGTPKLQYSSIWDVFSDKIYGRGFGYPIESRRVDNLNSGEGKEHVLVTSTCTLWQTNLEITRTSKPAPCWIFHETRSICQRINPSFRGKKQARPGSRTNQLALHQQSMDVHHWP